MRYEELITELCEVIKETEKDAEGIFDNTDEISKIIDNIRFIIKYLWSFTKTRFT